MYIQETNFTTKMTANMCTRLTHGVIMAGSCCVTDFNEKYQTVEVIIIKPEYMML